MLLQHRGRINELCPLRRRGILLISREEVILNQTFKNEGKRECWGQGMGEAHSNVCNAGYLGAHA